MKVLIATDMEGVSGIDRPEQCKPRNSPFYEAARAKLMHDTNAAVTGAYDGGATEVYVSDGHMGGGNFLDELLDPRAVKIERGRSVLENVDGAFLLGKHAMGGTMNAFLDHTNWHGFIFATYVNGRAYGEIGLFAARAGHYGVPVVMVSGCEAACKEARDFIGDLECAVVKKAVGRDHAVLLPLDEAHERIRAAACRSLARIADIRPFRPVFPAEVIQVYARTELADRDFKRGVERVDARTVRKIAGNALELAI